MHENHEKNECNPNLNILVRLQFDQMSVQASQYGDELRVVKGEVAEVNRLISRLQSEIEAVKAQVKTQKTFSHVEYTFA